MRYELATNKYGSVFYDTEGEGSLSLAKVLNLLNDAQDTGQFVARTERDDACKIARTLADECAALQADDKEAHKTLDQAGIHNMHLDRRMSVTERIDILAQRSTPHESPGRADYVAGLERAADKVLRVFGERELLGDEKSALASLSIAIKSG